MWCESALCVSLQVCLLCVLVSLFVVCYFLGLYVAVGYGGMRYGMKCENWVLNVRFGE